MTPFSQDAAETLALKALTWLAGNDELLPVFMGASGVTEDDVRAGAADPAFLAAVLDFLLMDDAWVVAFCSDLGIGSNEPMRARAGLPGGETVHWT